MNLAWFNYDILGNHQTEYNLLIEKFMSEYKYIYDAMFSDEIYGYRKGKMEMEANILYVNHYFYSIFQKINNLEDDTRENRIAILEDMQWECITKTLFCKNIKIGKYYNVILNLE